jgi:hypothetical protein
MPQTRLRLWPWIRTGHIDTLLRKSDTGALTLNVQGRTGQMGALDAQPAQQGRVF